MKLEQQRGAGALSTGKRQRHSQARSSRVLEQPRQTMEGLLEIARVRYKIVIYILCMSA